MLAYVFWHRPAEDSIAADYEAALTRFHAALAARPPEGFLGSAAFCVDAAPWLDGTGQAYEDWYLLQGSAALDVLDAAALDQRRAGAHDAVAVQAATGVAGLYRLAAGAGDRRAQVSALWLAAPRGAAREPLMDALTAVADRTDGALWVRAMTLGPAPELCLVADPEQITDAPALVTVAAIRQQRRWLLG